MAESVQARRLPPEIVSLIHHVELNRSGWWDRALDRLVLITVWFLQPITDEEVYNFLDQNLDHRVNRDRVFEVLAREQAGGTILLLGNNQLKVAEELSRGLTAELDISRRTRAELQERFAACTDSCGITYSEELWADFESHFVALFVKDMGARMYELLTGQSDLDTELASHGQLVKPLTEKYGDTIRQALIAFLDPQLPAVRQYVLQNMNAAFVRDAAGLDAEVISALGRARTRPDRAIVLLDTNFVFSFLGLHDNPGNQVAADLVRLAATVRDHIAVDFYILPITVDEVRRVLRDVIVRLDGVRPQRNLAAAAAQMSSHGLATAFLQAAATYSSGVLTSQQFFGPYEADLLTVLRDKGVQLLNENLDDLRVDQAVIDDITDLSEEQAEHRRAGVKPYEANLHDMVLWHFAKRRRPNAVDSPLDVGTWVCTLDYGLIGFDRRKQRTGSNPPICLTPSSLVQLVQFWAPRTDALDLALVGAMREPLLFLDFDRASENATLDILKALSRFERVGDLSPDTLVRVLSNDALRSRLERRQAQPTDDPMELVEAAVIEEAANLEAELRQTRAVATSTAQEVKAREVALAEKTTQMAQLLEVLNAKETSNAELREQIEKLSADWEIERQANQDELEKLKAQHQGVIDELSSRLRHFRDVLLLISEAIGSALGLGVGAYFGGLWLAHRISAPWVAWFSVALLGVFVLLLAVEIALSRLESIQLPLRFKRIRRSVGTVIVTLFLAVLATAIYQSLSTPQH